jgi:uncharacterized glyoxalase superfamily protein PhnB
VNAFREALPIVNVDDVEAAIGFYSATFGFEETFRYDEDGRAAFAFLALAPLGIGVARRAEGDRRDFALWLYADDVDDAAARLRAAGATEVLRPTEQPWGERMCTFVDPNGHLVHVGAKAN